MNRHLTYWERTKLAENSKQYVLKILGVSVWCSINSHCVKWFRIFGRIR